MTFDFDEFTVVLSMAPAKLPVEIRWNRGQRQRVFRLSRAIDPERIWFYRDIPFPSGETVELRFALPDDSVAFSATAELGQKEARFLTLTAAERTRIAHYHQERLGSA